MTKQANSRHETVEYGGRIYRKFIPYPKPVTDGSVRCFACGQIDEFEVHDFDLCLAVQRAARAAS